MCIQDIKLARNAFPKSGKSSGLNGTDVLMLPADATRYSLSASFANGSVVDADYVVLFYVKVGTLIFPLIGLTADHPADTVTLLDVGLAITYEIWANKINGANDPSACCFDACFQAPIEETAK